MSPKQISRAKFLENAELRKKLLSYSAVASLTAAAGMALAPSPALSAGTVIDVIPDETVSASAFPIDFDQDGHPEFALNHIDNSPTFFGVHCTLYSSSGDAGLSAIGYGTFVAGMPATFASALSFGAPVSALVTNWLGASLLAAANWGNLYGPWPGAVDQYVGVRFMIDPDGAGPQPAQAHYGWIELDVASDVSSFTISRYGYETVAGGGIPASVTLSNLQAASPVPLQVLAAGVFAALGGVLVWLRQRVGKRLKRDTA